MPRILATDVGIQPWDAEPTPEDLQDVWGSPGDPDGSGLRKLNVLPPKEANRPIPSRSEIEARIPEMLARSAVTRRIVVCVPNPWAGEFDPFEHPLSKRDEMLQEGLALLVAIRDRVRVEDAQASAGRTEPTAYRNSRLRVKCNLTGPNLMVVEGLQTELAPLLEGHPGLFQPYSSTFDGRTLTQISEGE